MNISLCGLLVRGGLPEEILTMQLSSDSTVRVRYFTETFGTTSGIDLAELLRSYHELQKEVEYERKARQVAEDALVNLCAKRNHFEGDMP